MVGPKEKNMNELIDEKDVTTVNLAIELERAMIS